MTEETKTIDASRSPADERGLDTSSSASREYTEPRRHRRRRRSKKAHSRFVKKASHRLLVALLILLVAVIGAVITVGLVEFFSFSTSQSS